MIEEGLVARLYAISAVTALVGTAGIYPVLLPKDALADALAKQLPSALTFQRIGGVTELSFEPALQCRLMRARYQFDCWSFKYFESKKLRRVVRAALLDFRGVLPDAGATVVRDVVPDAAIDMDSYEDGPRCWRSFFDLIVWYLEAVGEGGGGGNVVTFVDDEIVSGSGTEWTLAGAPRPVASLQVFQDLAGFGMVMLYRGTDYTLDNDTGPHFTTRNSIDGGALHAFYRK